MKKKTFLCLALVLLGVLLLEGIYISYGIYKRTNIASAVIREFDAARIRSDIRRDSFGNEFDDRIIDISSIISEIIPIGTDKEAVISSLGEIFQLEKATEEKNASSSEISEVMCGDYIPKDFFNPRLFAMQIYTICVFFNDGKLQELKAQNRIFRH